MEKSEIRREVRRRIKLLTAEQRESAAMQIFSHIETLEHFAQAECIALFVSMPDEVATTLALQRWTAKGKRVVVPRVEGDIMHFYDYSPENMQSGAFGILEPIGGEVCSPEAIDLIIVPARAFTYSGTRLGRGGGFYDKYISLSKFRAYKIGICYECQIFDSLPFDNHDIMVDNVVAR
mgnify:CR=1 FL=1